VVGVLFWNMRAELEHATELIESKSALPRI